MVTRSEPPPSGARCSRALRPMLRGGNSCRAQSIASREAPILARQVRAKIQAKVQEQIAASSQLNESQRNAMIRGMVERLAQRLQSDGSDPQGWLRRVRSYMVLGEPDKARAAAGDARRALAGDPVELRQFEDLVKALGLEG